MTPAHRSVHVAPLVVSALVLGATFASGVPADSEAVRLRRHVTAVERELLARDVSRLALAQRDDVIVNPQITPTYAIATGVAIAGGLTTILINASVPHTRISHVVSGGIGIMVGALGLALGVPGMAGDSRNFRPVAAVSAGVGALSLMLGVYALATPAPKSPGPPEKLESATLRAAPWVGPGGAGIMVGLRF